MPRLRYLGPLLLLGATACYEPPVRERVVLEIAADGTVRLSIETSFKQKDLSRKEQEEIRRVVEEYLDGRDPWLSGFERVEASEVTHALEGSEDAPEKIVREGFIPSVESLEELMPDAIANFTLTENARAGTRTLEILPIDVPQSIRRARHRMDREIGSFARALFEFSEAECDLYDHLSRNAERRHDLLEAVKDERIEGDLTPEETVLAGRLNEALGTLMAYASGATRDDEKEEPPLITRMSFSAFEHDFCVEVPSEATELLGLVPSEEGGAANIYCAERLVTDDLMKRVWPTADPPLFEDGVLQGLLDDAGALASAPFSCARYDGEGAIESRVWEEILPRPLYEISWSAAAPAPKP